jgi:hypothetical protein
MLTIGLIRAWLVFQAVDWPVHKNSTNKEQAVYPFTLNMRAIRAHTTMKKGITGTGKPSRAQL